MRWVVVAILALHALIHLMGFAKAFGHAELPRLATPISRAWGAAWLAAGALVGAAAVTLAAGARSTWIVGGIALVVSQTVILSAWKDAWAGTLANALLLSVAAHGWLTEGPTSFRARFDRDAKVGLGRRASAAVVTEADLAPLPAPVRRYLRAVGVVGRPRVVDYRLRFRGRIRSAPGARWMPFTAEQQSFADEPARLFLMRARMFGLPVESFHRFVGGHATMEVKLLGAIRLADARGDELDRSEAVTLFNDMCLMAPATLVDPAVTWEPVDAKTARARFALGGRSIAATLHFGDDDFLASFDSDDRSRLEADGRSFARLRFSTPVRDFRDYGPAKLPSHGEARWRLPGGEFTYGEFHLVEVEYDARE